MSDTRSCLRRWTGAAAMVAGMLVWGGSAHAAVHADQVIYYEPGLNANAGFTDPAEALTTTGVVSLGRWSDDPDTGTNLRPVGLTLGFSTSILNGAGTDLKIVGNAFTGWYEPGYIEVARETSGIGATSDGWEDELFYLIKPSNWSSITDPRLGPVAINYTYPTFSDLHWQGQNTLYGYADVRSGGNFIDLADAIDADGNAVALADIAYIRIRTVTDSLGGPLGFFTTEVSHVEAINGVVPEPGMAGLFLSAGVLLMRRRGR